MKTQHIFFLTLIGLALLGAATAATAQPEAFSLNWWTVDGGGGDSSGGAFILTGTIGQADAGGMRGEGYELSGGFWPGAPEPPPASQYRTFMPVMVRQ